MFSLTWWRRCVALKRAYGTKTPIGGQTSRSFKKLAPERVAVHAFVLERGMQRDERNEDDDPQPDGNVERCEHHDDPQQITAADQGQRPPFGAVAH